MTENNGKFNFTREERRLEYKLNRKNIDEIEKLNIPQVEKRIIIDELWNRIFDYESQYARYQRLFRWYNPLYDSENLPKTN